MSAIKSDLSANHLNDSCSDAITSTETGLVNKLRSSLEFTCKKLLSGIKYSLFKTKFKEIYKKDPASLKNIYDQLCSQITESIATDIDQLCKEHSIEFLLNFLDSLKKEQESYQSSWRPSGNPYDDLKDHIYPIKVRQKEALQELLTKLQNNNEDLINTATVNHAEIMHMKKNNEELHEKFSNIITSLTGPNLENLKNSLMNVEKEE